MILAFQTRFSFVRSSATSYEAVDSSKVMSREELTWIRKLSPEEFEAAFESQLRSENRESLRSLYFMKEAYRRRDWSVSHSSFNRYCVRWLKMSDSDFYRKFAIMKTLEELPEIEEKILDGSLNQATVGRTIQFLRKESRSRPVAKEQKRELLSQMENKTEREVERELAALSPESAIPDRVKQISADGFLRQFTSDQDLEDKFSRLRDLLAHCFSGRPSDLEFFRKLAEIALNQVDPEIKDEKRAKRLQQRLAKNQTAAGVGAKNDVNVTVGESSAKLENAEVPFDHKEEAMKGTDAEQIEANPLSTPQTQCFTELRKRCVTKPNREKPSSAILRKVRIRDEYQCTHTDPTDERCKSRFALEVDHIVAVADGGSNEPENLRLVCRTHNQLYAIQRFGQAKMARHMQSDAIGATSIGVTLKV